MMTTHLHNRNSIEVPRNIKSIYDTEDYDYEDYDYEDFNNWYSSCIVINKNYEIFETDSISFYTEIFLEKDYSLLEFIRDCSIDELYTEIPSDLNKEFIRSFPEFSL